MGGHKDCCGHSDSDHYDSLTCSSCDSSSNSSSSSNKSCSDSSSLSSCSDCKSSNSCCSSSSSCSSSSCEPSSCEPSSCEPSSCSCDCSKSCVTVSCDSDCYDPDYRPDCDEDCPKKCKPFNIYWFGSSITDAGDGRLNLGLEPYTKTSEDLGQCGTVTVGLGPCARATNGKVYPQFIAEDLCMELDLEYDLSELPKEKNHLVSFSLIGATQSDNVIPLTPANKYGYEWQIDRYLQLYKESACYTIPEKDLFMYTDVGSTEVVKLMKLFLDGTPVDPIAYFQSYVDKVLANVIKLYSLGKARRMFVQLIDANTIVQAPFYEVFACALGQTADDIMIAFNNAQNSLNNQLTAFANSQPHFDLTVIESSNIYETLANDSGLYGIINDGNTMIELGWPDKLFENQLWFDSFHLTSHSNRVVANYVKTWFQQRICSDC